jgi:hypothetical protein
MAFSLYLILLPFTAELAWIPLIGGCLLNYQSQSAAIIAFSISVTFACYALISSILALKHNLYLISVILAIVVAGTVTMICKVGEPVPRDYAKYLLGYM